MALLFISIGSLGKQNTWAQVRNVMVDGAVLSNTENGVRIKTWQVCPVHPFFGIIHYASPTDNLS